MRKSMAWALTIFLVAMPTTSCARHSDNSWCSAAIKDEVSRSWHSVMARAEIDWPSISSCDSDDEVVYVENEPTTLGVVPILAKRIEGALATNDWIAVQTQPDNPTSGANISRGQFCYRLPMASGDYFAKLFDDPGGAVFQVSRYGGQKNGCD